jgi:hypothetical protein
MLQSNGLIVGSNGQTTVWRFGRGAELEYLGIHLGNSHLFARTRTENLQITLESEDTPVVLAMAIAEEPDPSSVFIDMRKKQRFADVVKASQFGLDENVWIKLVTPPKELEIKQAVLSNHLSVLEF